MSNEQELIEQLLDQIRNGADPATINSILEFVSQQMFGVNSQICLKYSKWADLKEQDVNANVMPPEMFNALVRNIDRTGALESVPLTACRPGSEKIEIVSGHHRKRAAVQAGQEWGLHLHYKELTADEIRAKQLAHNSIQGNSDPEIVLAIFNSIDDLDARMETYINPSELAVPEPMQFQMVDLDILEHSKTVTLIFLPTQADKFDKAIKLLAGEEDAVYVANAEVFDRFRDALASVRKNLEVYSVPTAVAQMAEIVLSAMQEIEEANADGTEE